MTNTLKFVTTLTLAATLEWFLARPASAQNNTDGPEHPRAEATKEETTPKEQAPAAAPLTERERQLLDQIRDLERRLLTLESKVAATTPSDSAVWASSSQTPAALAESEAAKPPAPKAADPFAFADFTWLNGNPRTKESPLDSKVLTGEFRADTSYIYDFNHPRDNTLIGTSESGRTGEFQVQQLGIGGDFHYDKVRGRLMTQFGMYSTMTPRNDASPSRGQWNLADAYRYIAEAYGGYHVDKWNV